ncbi:MAG: hypothetical protein NTW19_18875 [Planctomycetota bacterium]|nr:hypothetical protein [Planctomycetota bacterium]
MICSSLAIGADGSEKASSPATQPAAGLFAPGEAPAQAPANKKAAEKLPEGQSINVGSFGQVELHVKDAELTQVLQLLSIQSQRNIVATKSVAGSVSADLYGVDFYEALDAILHTNGFGYREKGNFVYVYTVQEIKAMDEADKKVVHRVVRLNYLNAADAATIIEPLKSTAGSIAVSGKVAPGFQPSLGDGGANSHADVDTLVIRDFPENVDEMAGVLKELDIKPKQVLVEATVLEAKLSEANGFGVDMTILADFNMATFANPLAAVPSLLNGTVQDKGTAITTPQSSSDLQGKAGFKLGVVSDNVAAFIHALDSVTDTTVLAKPKLLVLNRQKADLLVGTRLAYLSTTTTDTSATQTVQYLDSGTHLTVRPFISDEGFIRMELKPSVSTASLRSIGTGNSSTTVPDQSTEELTTNIMVRNGQTIVLGGLFKESTTVARRQAPLLGDVPILGTAFKGQDDSAERAEVIFMVTPTIMKDDSLYAVGERAKDSAEQARLGARQGLLPWSRTKLTSGHVNSAIKARDAGNKEKAIWEAKRAVSLDPTYVEARRLLEELTGQREYVADRSLLQDAVDHQIKLQLDDKPAVPVPAAKPGKASAAPAPTPAPAAAPAPAPAAKPGPSAQATPAVAPVNETEEITVVPVGKPSQTAEVEVAPAAVQAGVETKDTAAYDESK